MNIPDANMVIVFTADYPPLFYDHRKREENLENLLVLEILPLILLKSGENL